MRPARTLPIALLILGLLAPTVFGASSDGACPPGTPSKNTKGDARVSSFDSVDIAITWFRPGNVCPDHPVPVIFYVHGWSQSRPTGFDATLNGGFKVQRILEHGYGFVGIDARGHGESGGQAFLQHPTTEVRDYQAVFDWVHDRLTWVQREGSPREKDIVAGGAGASYGGGFQLMTAAFDDRLDAIVPVTTWNNLAQALAPNWVPRSVWLSLLYAGAKLSVDVDPRIDQWFAETMAMNRPPAAAVSALLEASPATWIESIDIPTLLVQGLPDTLFTLNQAVDNFRGIRENGAPVWLLGVNTGHILPGLQPTGLGAVPDRLRTKDCADPVPLALSFYDAFLKQDRDARSFLGSVPRVILPTEQGDCVTGSNWPISRKSTEVTFPALAAPETSGSYVLPLLTAEKRTVVAGIPRIRATVPAQLDDIFFVSLVVPQGDGFRIVDDQVTPIRTQLAGLRGRLDVDLAGVATTLEPGEQLLLKVDALNEQFALNGSRRPGAVLLTDVTFSLPIVSQLSKRVESR
ncbi:MAG: alpha/beta hydrolase family protein [Actinomycetota bacterium]